MEKLNLYEQLREVPKEAQKDFDNGSFKGTDINSMWRIKKLTETFGPCGIGWYYKIVDKWIDTIDDNVIVNIQIDLFYKLKDDWSMPIVGVGGNQLKKTFKSGKVNITDEAYKMALTDAIGVACKNLGMGADIYWQNDKTKYSNEELNYKQLVKDKVEELGIDFKEYAIAHKLSAKTTQEEAKQLLDELNG